VIETQTRPPVLRLYEDELVADLFAGGGGASTGIERAIGRSPDVAINHDKDALAMHEANHPETTHLRGDVYHYDPDTVAAGRRFAFAWFSPDCTYHSKAKGGVPFRDKRKARRVRGLAWVMARWAESKVAKPRILFMENVEEILDWGPLIEVAPGQYRPDPLKKGTAWRRLVSRLRAAGYSQIEWRKLRAMHYGAPTSRQRLVMIARCDGLPIAWPEVTHGPKAARPYRTAAECIDFTLPVPSIFLTAAEATAWGRLHGVPSPRRPLAAATLRRVARGVMRYVVECADPFIVPVMHQGDDRVHSVREPIRTLTGAHRGEFALVSPLLINTRNGERHGRHGEQAPRLFDIHAPYPTITALGSQGAMVAAFLAKHNGGHEATGQKLTKPADTLVCRENKALVAAHLVRYHGEKREGDFRGQDLGDPITTLDTSNRFGLVASSLVKLRGGLFDHVYTSQDVREPVTTLTAGGTHVAEVRAFLVKFFGTGVARSLFEPAGAVTTRDRFGLVVVTVAGEEYVLVDIGMRMLTPRELFLLQGFPKSYIIERAIVDGRPKRFTKGTQTRLCGNSVPPDLAEAVVMANLSARADRVWRDEATA
jgi:DNA (cytosine-5)-methyltransferase 1